MGFFDGAGAGIWGPIGGFLGRDDRRQEADHAMDRSDAFGREQMAFQERMSNSAYQRARTDMEKAGYNPMLAYAQGGASTPAGSSGGAAVKPDSTDWSKALSSVVDAMRLKNETDQVGSNKALNDALATKALADSKASGASTRQMEVQTKATESQLKAIESRAKADEAKARYDYKASTYDAIMNRVNRDSNSAVNVLNMFLKGNKSQTKPWEGQLKDGTIYNKGTGEVVP